LDDVVGAIERADVEVLNAICETDFLGFSFGFHPGRSQHDCLDALYVAAWTRRATERAAPAALAQAIGGLMTAHRQGQSGVFRARGRQD
jgi:hypothetical protein